ncbi:hypothetical protein ACFB49_19880 [Sphingomonas sp. DBB INV C78]
MAACVCPVVGSAALTLSVPQVREAVHKATAPRQYAKPKTRVRKPAAEVAAAAIAPCPTAVPVILSALELPAEADSVLPPIEVASLNPGTVLGPPRTTPFNPVRPGGGGVPNPNIGTEPTTPLLPDATTWVQMILGFGLIGGAVRVSQARQRRRVLAKAEVTVSFSGIRPESERPFT